MAVVDVRLLVDRGRFRVVGGVPDWPMFAAADVESFDAIDELRAIVTERLEWWAESMDRRDAAQILGLTPDQIAAALERHSVRAGRFGRYRRVHVEAAQKHGAGRSTRVCLRASIARMEQ